VYKLCLYIEYLSALSISESIANLPRFTCILEIAMPFPFLIVTYSVHISYFYGPCRKLTTVGNLIFIKDTSFVTLFIECTMICPPLMSYLFYNQKLYLEVLLKALCDIQTHTVS
jgi:hypothetical protein